MRIVSCVKAWAALGVTFGMAIVVVQCGDDDDATTSAATAATAGPD